MIHSLAGGNLSEERVCDIAKVKVLSDGVELFCLCEFSDIKVGDIVSVPYGNLDNLERVEVLRIDKKVNSKNFPMNFDMMKRIQKNSD